MKLLLHTCCAPCLLIPLEQLRKEGKFFATPYFYNPNIHPYQEFKKRRQSLENYAQKNDIPLLLHRDYGLDIFLQEVFPTKDSRCIRCYAMRLQGTAQFARENGFDAFSTTLLYSRYQQHNIIRDIGFAVAKAASLSFHYQDFREDWERGQVLAEEEKLYKQAYCGCIFSEQERYDNRWKKRMKKKYKTLQGEKNGKHSGSGNDQ